MFAGHVCSNPVRYRALGGLVAAFMLAASPALAQPGGGWGIPPEERAKVEAAQSGAVAASLKLDAEKSAKLAEAYTAYKKSAAESRPGGEGRPAGEGRPDFEAMMKQQQEQQAKLEITLKAFLDETQAKEAASTLGGFNRGWDRQVSVILGFGLEEGKQAEALGHTLAFVKKSAESRAGGGGSREEMMAARKALDDALAPLLSDAQKAEWSEKTSRGGRGGGGGGGGERGERGGRGERPGDGAAPAGAPN